MVFIQIQKKSIPVHIKPLLARLESGQSVYQIDHRHTDSRRLKHFNATQILSDGQVSGIGDIWGEGYDSENIQRSTPASFSVDSIFNYRLDEDGPDIYVLAEGISPGLESLFNRMANGEKIPSVKIRTSPGQFVTLQNVRLTCIEKLDKFQLYDDDGTEYSEYNFNDIVAYEIAPPEIGSPP